jgi:bacteriocin-like protein
MNHELNTDELSNVSGGVCGSQVSMINLQSNVSKWSTMIQAVTNIMNSTDSGINSVMKNIKG